MARAMSLNRFMWVEGNVINHRDPSGLGTPVCVPTPYGNQVCTVVPSPDEVVKFVSGVGAGVAVGLAAIIAAMQYQKPIPASELKLSECLRTAPPQRSAECNQLLGLPGVKEGTELWEEAIRKALGDNLWRRIRRLWNQLTEPDPDENPGPVVPRQPVKTPDPSPQPTLTPCGTPTLGATPTREGKVCDPKKVLAWMAPFGKKPVNPTNPDWSAYQFRTSGPFVYEVDYHGIKIDTDGIRPSYCAFLESKYVADPNISPYVPGSNAFPPVRDNARDQIIWEVARYRAIIFDQESPMLKVEFITNNAAAQTYLQTFLFSVSGQAVLIP
jgi:hypothetical protein